jgi:hypothetical protein
VDRELPPLAIHEPDFPDAALTIRGDLRLEVPRAGAGRDDLDHDAALDTALGAGRPYLLDVAIEGKA